ARASFRNRISREKANEICIKLLEKYEENIPIDNYGKTIQEVYDMDKIVPRQEYLDQFKRMKEELAELGVEYPY
ncbi:MAG: monomethylamine:corrinoid methyltransferase, partial [Acetomicrobium sp.]